MTEQPKIQMTALGGLYLTTPSTLDRMVETYLPASVNQLRTIVRERVLGWDDPDDSVYADVHSVTEFLMILADMETE